MADLFASVEGHRVTAARLMVTNVGPWILDCDFEEAPDLAGRVVAQLGTLELHGTVVNVQGGTFGLQRKARIVAGAAGWGNEVAPKNYHNDLGVKARVVADDAAHEVGETLGRFEPVSDKLRADYIRRRVPASVVLTDAAGADIPWWVDYAGTTNVGKRVSGKLDKSKYEVLFFDPRSRVATIALDDPASLFIGAELVERLDDIQVVRDFEIVLDGNQFHVTAWCGGSQTGRSRLAGLLAELIERHTARTLHGKYRYRVLRTVSDRADLQVVRAAAGLPDIIPAPLWPGVPGVEAELTKGSEVLVEFIEGDPTQPIITHFAGKHDGGAAFVPVSLTLCGSTQRVARQGDLVQCGGEGTQVVLIGPPTPPNGAVAVGVPYLISFSALPTPQAPLYGAISTGSPKVKA